MNDLDKAQMMAPEGEFLAYINPKEAGILRALGGSGKMTAMGIPSFTEDDEDQAAMNAPDYSSQDNEEQQSIDRGDPTANMSTRSRDLQGFGPGTNINDLYGGGGGGNNFLQTVGNLYSRFSPITNIGRGIRGIGRGIGNLFSRLADLRGFNPDGSRRTQTEYEQARTARQNQNRISDIMGRDAPFTRTTLNNLEGLYENLYGKGNVPSNINDSLIGTTNAMRTINDPIFGDVTRGTIYDAEDPELGILSQAPDYNFRDAMSRINLQPGFNARQNLSAANFIDQNKAIGSEDTRNIQDRIGNTFGFNSNNIDLTKTFGLEELLASGAAKKGMAYGYNLTDQGKALENFRKDALGMNNPKNKNFAPYKGLGAQFQLNQLIKNENKNAMENKNYIQEQINKGFLQNKEDFINQEALGKYL